MERPVVLVADGDAARRAAAQETLTRSGFAVLGASAWPEALDHLRRRNVRVLVLDVATPGVRDGGAAVREAEAARPAVTVVLTRAAAPPAVDVGVFDALPGDADARRIAAAVAAAARQAGLREELRELRHRLREVEGFERIVGRTRAMETLRDRIAAAASREAPVLIRGEEGSGRTLAARVLHETSPRARGPFAIVHVAAFAPERLEAELFGAEPGPGGRTAAGALDGAAGGTLLLDEVGALPIALQERLARFVEDGVVHRAGRGVARSDARIVATTSRDLDRAVEEQRFDAGLHAALAATALDLPPLRERIDDVAVLARHFLDAIAEINGLPSMTPTAETLETLRGYGWPGNVRELRNALEQAAILSVDGVVRPRDLPERVLSGGAREGREEAESYSGTFRGAKRKVVARFERRYLSDLMARNGGNVTVAAQEAGMLRSALQRLLRKHRLRSADFRRAETASRVARTETDRDA